MSAPPSGWYPDPQQPVPGAPAQQRYWDGQAWTPHVAPIAQPPIAQTPMNQPAYPQAQYSGQPTDYQPTDYQQPAYGGQYGGQYVAQTAGSPTTPDGAQLAGWWHRVGAHLIDGLILSTIVGVLAFPFIGDVVGALSDFIDEATRAAQNGNPAPSPSQLELDIAGAAVAIAAISLATNLVYTVAFLLWKQATPGKLALGLRVRLRGSPDLPLAAVLLRWATQSALPGLVGLVPFLGFAGGIFSFLDALWPLWDDKRQALHDKVARTNVVRVR